MRVKSAFARTYAFMYNIDVAITQWRGKALRGALCGAC